MIAWSALPVHTRRLLIGAGLVLLLGLALGVVLGSPELRGILCPLLGVGGLVGAGAAREAGARRAADEEAAREARAHAERLRGASERVEQARTDAMGDDWRERVDERLEEWRGDDR